MTASVYLVCMSVFAGWCCAVRVGECVVGSLIPRALLKLRLRKVHRFHTNTIAPIDFLGYLKKVKKKNLNPPWHLLRYRDMNLSVHLGPEK